MVKIGFICEGETEKIIIQSENFKQFLLENDLELVNAIDATGNGNLLPENIQPFIKILKDDGAEKIFILTDLDTDKCITTTKKRINAPGDIVVIISVQQIEAWFLADSFTLSSIFKSDYVFHNPEKENYPREKLKEIFIEKTGRGIMDSKPRFAKWIIKQGFSILNAAQHSNCTSAKYFIDAVIKSK